METDTYPEVRSPEAVMKIEAPEAMQLEVPQDQEMKIESRDQNDSRVEIPSRELQRSIKIKLYGNHRQRDRIRLFLKWLRMVKNLIR